jgi:hypothetical protein
MMRYALWTGPALALVFSATTAMAPTVARQANDKTVLGFEALRTAPIVAVTPDAREVPVTAQAQPVPAAGASPSIPAPATTTPTADAARVAPVTAPAVPTRERPRTAGALPLVGGIGVFLIGVATMMVVLRRRAAVSMR